MLMEEADCGTVLDLITITKWSSMQTFEHETIVILCAYQVQVLFKS